METQTHSVTIEGETRDVEFYGPHGPGRKFMNSVNAVAVFSKHGGKLWREKVTLCFTGGEWVVMQNTTILNRSDYALRGWADVLESTSLHNSAREA